MTQRSRGAVPATDRTGGAGSFEGFFQEVWGDACRTAALLVQDRTAGEEIAQDALLQMYQRWRSIDDPHPFLRRCLVNASKNWHRHRAVQRAKLPVLAASASAQVPATDDLSDALAALPHRQRAVIVLRYYGGYSETEIADALSCRPGTVKSLSHRARASLHRALTERDSCNHRNDEQKRDLP